MLIIYNSVLTFKCRSYLLATDSINGTTLRFWIQFRLSKFGADFFNSLDKETVVMIFLDKEMGIDFLAYSKQVAIITYTNAACDEISRRLQYKSIFAVSTIHSFLWELIKNYQLDIKEWIRAEIISDIADLEDKQSRGRTGAAQIERAEKIEKNKARLAKLNTIKRFSYNPNGENFGHDLLNHAEVIKIGSDFIAKNETMQKILVSKYPILLIDESQDTKKELIDALFTLHENDKSGFIIGMFGDNAENIHGRQGQSCHLYTR